MVNLNLKKEIHNHLISSGEWLSGERLSSILNVSRVAIWKHLQKMKEAGYPLLSSHQGYKLNPAEDTLAPWALDFTEREIHHYPVIESTMNEARQIAEFGTSPGALVLAEEQTRGRGRLGRSWDSGEGGLYFTIIEYPQGDLKGVYGINTRAVLAVRDSLKMDFGLECWCREPNDIWTKEGKIAGILLEVSAEIERIRYVNIGIGINVRSIHREKSDNEAMLEDIIGKRIKRRELLSTVLLRYEKNKFLKGNTLETIWKKSLLNID
ncbi:MAG: biotin--[acetyl-CoA-carboxylase] ligase [Spirochaetales bacterium]|nr:biotin--[acetyl-CoA-carboxylase] ligase [Spirochaetales bacterium]